MVPLSQLQWARKYPFSTQAKIAVKQLSPDLERMEPSTIDVALSFVEACAATSPKARRAFVERHFSKRDLSYAEFVQNDVLAFPLTKILLSQQRNPMLYERFAQLMGDLTFEYLIAEKDKVNALVELANDFKVKVGVVPNEPPSIVLPLGEYLSIPLKDGQLHLVHQALENGKVKLEWNLACRWMAEVVHAHVLNALPVDTKGLPALFNELQKKVDARMHAQRTYENKQSLSSGIIIEAFPPCMDKMHSEITSGVNLPHMARFDLATFLINIRMPFEDIVNVFSKASNYDEKITRYHLDNLSGKTSGKVYSSPACAKVREHGLCISRTCNVTHPIQFYRRESVHASDKKETNGENEKG